ncbi:uncharacterized protein [Littorina saxatilis]|uniref:PB1 domain-containing protein n=1 Tax=Littorina saxatilis TaxID=31220 RepID=A0AAN9B480_9CAEN
MQRPQEKTRDIAAIVKATQSNKTTLLHSEEEEDFEILCTQSLEEESAKMTEKNVKLPGAMKVKALLQREGQVEGSSPEIRRFNVTEVTYKALVTRVRSVFNFDQEQHCCLFWKDDDEDLVQFSTSRELRHALDNMPDDTLRVHVTVTPDVTKAASEPEQENEKAGARQDKMAKKGLANKQNNEEFNAVRQQVPETFRGWVRQYVRTWFQQGAETANQIDTLPEGAPPHFRQWLHDFLSHWTQRHAGKASSGETGIEEGDKVEEMLSAPEGLPPLYYRWICLFMPRFYQRYTKRMAAFSGNQDGGQVPQCPKGHGRLHGHGFRHGRVHHGGCQGEKGGKREGQSSSSESEDSDCGEKMWKKVPKELRKYVRVSVKQLHKDKGDNPKAKEKATRDGLSPEVMEFVDQIIPEWHAKLSQKRPRDVALEMMEGEISLPAGLEKDHFLWMCRFMARWHRRHAGKCDVISAWSSGETDDSSSGEERQGGCSRQRHFHCTVNAMPGHHPFAMHYGMPHGCNPPTPPHMIGCMTPPPPPPFFAPHRMNFTARKMGFGVMPQGQMLGCGARCYRKGHGHGQGQGCRRSMNQDGVPQFRFG